MPLTRANSLDKLDGDVELAKLINDPDVQQLIKQKLGSKKSVETGPNKLNQLIDLTRQL